MNGKFSDSTSIPDDAFRNDLFGQFIKAADPYMLFFSAGDINDLVFAGICLLKKIQAEWRW